MAKFGMVVCALYAVICVLSMVAAEYLSLTAGYTKELGGTMCMDIVLVWIAGVAFIFAAAVDEIDGGVKRAFATIGVLLGAWLVISLALFVGHLVFTSDIELIKAIVNLMLMEQLALIICPVAMVWSIWTIVHIILDVI